MVSLVNDDIGCHSPTPTVINSQHLVLHSYLQQEADKPAEWFLFNDFSIEPSSSEDTLYFSHPWRIPICFVYENVDYDSDLLNSLLTGPLRPTQPFYSSISLGAPN